MLLTAGIIIGAVLGYILLGLLLAEPIWILTDVVDYKYSEAHPPHLCRLSRSHSRATKVCGVIFWGIGLFMAMVMLIVLLRHNFKTIKSKGLGIVLGDVLERAIGQKVR